jgi:predicted permease
MIGLDIFTSVILPIFILIGLGVLVDRFIEIDVKTLARLTFTLFMPALVFVNLVKSQLDPTSFASIAAFTLVHFALLLGLSLFLYSVPPFRSRRVLLTMGTIFYNSGNYGTPFAALAFGSLGVSVLAIVLMVQSVTIFTLGVWMVNPVSRNLRGGLTALLSVPVVYAVVAALIVRAVQLPIPEVVWQPLQYLANAVVPAALVTLGIQLGRSRLTRDLLPLLSAATVIRLLLSPLMALGLLFAWRAIFPGSLDTSGQILVVAAGLPAAVNITVLAIEYKREPETASQMVFLTTLLSAVTLTAWLWFTGRAWF